MLTGINNNKMELSIKSIQIIKIKLYIEKKKIK
jgi:hypothetical protein